MSKREREGNEGKGEEERLEVREADQKTLGTRRGDESGPNQVQRPLLLGQPPHGRGEREWTGRADQRTGGRPDIRMDRCTDEWTVESTNLEDRAIPFRLPNFFPLSLSVSLFLTLSLRWIKHERRDRILRAQFWNESRHPTSRRFVTKRFSFLFSLSFFTRYFYQRIDRRARWRTRGEGRMDIELRISRLYVSGLK